MLLLNRYTIALFALLASHGYVLYYGYDWANQKCTNKTLQSKVSYLETLRRYLRTANQQSQSEAATANEALASKQTEIEDLKALIDKIQENPICVDKEFLELLRRSRQ